MPPAALEKLKPFIGTTCTCTWQGDAGTRIRFIDWSQLETKQQLLDTLFKECEVPGDYAEVIGTMNGGIAWMSGKLVPIAFVGEQDGSDSKHLEAIVVLDVSKPSGTVYSIPVEGTAVPQKKLTRVAASFEALKVITGVAPSARAAPPPAAPKPKAPPKSSKKKPPPSPGG